MGLISPEVAFKGPNVVLGPYKCNVSLTRGKELGAATGEKQGAGPDSACGPCVCHPCSRSVLFKHGFGLRSLSPRESNSEAQCPQQGE